VKVKEAFSCALEILSKLRKGDVKGDVKKREMVWVGEKWFAAKTS